MQMALSELQTNKVSKNGRSKNNKGKSVNVHVYDLRKMVVGG